MKPNNNYVVASFLIVVTSLLYYFFPSNYTRQIKKATFQASVLSLTQAVSPTPTVQTQSESTIKKVIRVIDGDTIVIEGGQKVRYIGVDSPEIHSPKKAKQCFGDEAAKKNEELVLNMQVRLEKDVSETDRYGRLLRYVYVQASNSGELFVNEELVRQGFANAATFPPDVRNAEQFAQLEKQAREAKVGFWLSCRSEK